MLFESLTSIISSSTELLGSKKTALVLSKSFDEFLVFSSKSSENNSFSFKYFGSSKNVKSSILSKSNCFLDSLGFLFKMILTAEISTSFEYELKPLFVKSIFDVNGSLIVGFINFTT